MSEKPKGSLIVRAIVALFRIAILVIFGIVLLPFVYFYATRIPTRALADEAVVKAKTCYYDRSTAGMIQRSGLLKLISFKTKILDVHGATAHAVDRVFEDAKVEVRRDLYQRLGEFTHQKLLGCIRKQSCREFTRAKTFCPRGDDEWQLIVFSVAYSALKNIGLSN